MFVQRTMYLVICFITITSTWNNHGMNVNRQLLIAASNGDAEQVEKYLNNNAQVNTQDDRNKTPLHIAASSGNPGVMPFLVEKGANVNARTNDNTTPLHLATQHGHTLASKQLVELGADVNAQDDKIRNQYSIPLNITT